MGNNKKEKKKSNKKYTKILNFASIILDPSFCNTTNQSTAVKDALKKVFNAKTLFDGEGFDTMDEGVNLELTDSFSLGKDLILTYKVLK